MTERKCARCGAPLPPDAPDSRIYCGKACKRAANSGRRPNASQRFEACLFNAAVECAEKGEHCARCGWNPAVAKKRLEAIRGRLKGA